ncbi:hypothetical protein KI387_036262, partial [Taxus chinensis]
QKVFEWDQSLEELDIYIPLPKNVPTKLFYCKIQSQHLEVGIKGNPPYLNHDLTSPVKVDSSIWTLEDDIMHITLQKRDKGKTWPSPIHGQGELDPYSVDQEQRRLMLQRFQEETFSTHCKWEAFKGADSNDKNFAFPAKKSSLFQLKTMLEVFMAGNKDDKVSDFHGHTPKHNGDGTQLLVDVVLVCALVNI